MEQEDIQVLVAGPEHETYVDTILQTIADAAKATAAQLLENLVETSVSYVSQVLAEEIGKNQEGVVLQGIQIQNLNINLTAEVVQQLNMNPNEVKNIFGEQIKEATVKAIVQKLSDI